MTVIYRLEETTYAGNTMKRTLKSFTTKEKAENWLTEKGYEYIEHVESWEKADEQEHMVDVYVEIHPERVE